jgi:hypothetical protein
MLNSLTWRRAGLAIGLAGALLAAGALAIGASARDGLKPPAELRVVTAEVGPGGGMDVPPQGDSIGDTDTFTSVGTDPKTGKRLGTAEATCAIFEIAKPGGYGPPAVNTTYHCTSIAHLRDGNLMFVQRVRFDGNGRPDNEPAAIVGGTGRYAGAHGWVSGKPLRGGKTLTILHFVR